MARNINPSITPPMRRPLNAGTIRSEASYLVEGEPVCLPASSKDEPWLHDPCDIDLAFKLARVALLEEPYLGVFFKGTAAGP